MLKIDFYHIKPSANHRLTYVVICAMHKNQWVLVRHKDRQTWEIPGGHIEAGEAPDQAASRELREETGATAFEIKAVCDYSVESNSGKGYGRLYFARIERLQEKLEHETAEVIFSNELPEELTYKDIQPRLLEEVKRRCLNG